MAPEFTLQALRRAATRMYTSPCKRIFWYTDHDNRNCLVFAGLRGDCDRIAQWLFDGYFDDLCSFERYLGVFYSVYIIRLKRYVDWWCRYIPVTDSDVIRLSFYNSYMSFVNDVYVCSC